MAMIPAAGSLLALTTVIDVLLAAFVLVQVLAQAVALLCSAIAGRTSTGRTGSGCWDGGRRWDEHAASCVEAGCRRPRARDGLVDPC